MRKLKRLPLSRQATQFLKKQRTERVEGAADSVAEARRLWSFQRNHAFREVRDTLRRMTPGDEHCMYCESGEATDIDHYRPLSRFPLLAFVWSNYLLACHNCNSNYKRSQFPLDAEERPLLLDPTVDDPSEHLELLPSTGDYRGTSSRGRKSIEVYGLQRATLCSGRRDAWIVLQELIIGYASRRSDGDTVRARDLERVIREYPFASVFGHLVRLSRHREARHLMDESCLAALDRHPEILTWSHEG